MTRLIYINPEQLIHCFRNTLAERYFQIFLSIPLPYELYIIQTV